MNKLLILITIISLLVDVSAQCSADQVSSGCATCSGANCDTCISSAVKISSYVCQLCTKSFNFCETCTYLSDLEYTICDTCYAGYYYSFGCQQCPTSLTNCTACSSDTVCTACSPGYTVSSGACVVSSNPSKASNASNAAKVIFTFFALIAFIFFL